MPTLRVQQDEGNGFFTEKKLVKPVCTKNKNESYFEPGIISGSVRCSFCGYEMALEDCLECSGSGYVAQSSEDVSNNNKSNMVRCSVCNGWGERYFCENKNCAINEVLKEPNP